MKSDNQIVSTSMEKKKKKPKQIQHCRILNSFKKLEKKTKIDTTKTQIHDRVIYFNVSYSYFFSSSSH